MNKLMRTKIIGLALLVGPATSSALEPIPEENGVSGFLSLGIAAASIESNTLAEVASQDLSDDTIDDLGSPDSETAAFPAVAFELGYTWNGNTQIFVGNLIEDYLRFDFSTRAGIRHNVGNLGRIGFSVLATPVATKVYENPYQTGVKRDSTDRTSEGFRFTWDEMFGTGLEIRYSAREVELDDENSGEGILDPDGNPLTQNEIDSLNREGDRNTLQIRYAFTKTKENIVIGGINMLDADLDGDAMAYDGTGIELNWIHQPDTNKYVTNILVGQRDFDDDNPVFGKKADSDYYALSFAGFYPGAWGFKDWIPNFAVVVGEDSSDIGFFDTQINLITFGFLTRF